jgi:hypothetical protein
MGTEGVSEPVLKEKLINQAFREIPDCLFLWSQKGHLVGLERFDRDIVRFCEFWKVIDNGILYLYIIYFYLSGGKSKTKENAGRKLFRQLNYGDSFISGY